mmetsp:Transcript_92864/g.206553  ORF Transcript_92864/g.206553 Transcript_92864/m.206553 type:complete len:471 (+) Transcript_92864:104-1516(+)
MGGATSKTDVSIPADEVQPEQRELVEGQGESLYDGGKPYFFVASCPDNALREANALARKYGGFHTEPDEGDNLMTLQEGRFAAWKGKVEGQFMTLKALTKGTRPVIGIAIAGFGNCNEEREFLARLGKKKGHEQFRLKQCGDVADMERWLRSEGYQPVQVLGLACQPVFSSAQTAMESAFRGQEGVFNAMETTRTRVWESMTTLLGTNATGGGGSSMDARRERLLGDVQMSVEASLAVDTANAEALQEARDKLAGALKEALAAGVAASDLEEAANWEKELGRLAEEAASRKSRCLCCCCCPSSASTGKAPDGEEFLGAAATQYAAQDEVLRSRAGSYFPLPEGTKCRYNSASRSGWVDALVEGFNRNDATYNLDVRQHAKLEYISPDPSVSASEAWPPGALVEYDSNQRWTPAVVISFNEGPLAKGAKGKRSGGTYDLDVQRRASVDRMRPRLPGTGTGTASPQAALRAK